MSIILQGLDPRLDEILKPTYYQLLYQEQAMEITQVLAGYSAGQADTIRKTIGRKIQSELDALIPELIEKFQSYGGLSFDAATTIGETIRACGAYSFNKSHSVEYGLIAYQTAYLKANYPLEYMCALLNGNMDSLEDTTNYIRECKDMGIEILPPSVAVGNLKFKVEDSGIRIGITYIKGINNIEIKYTPGMSIQMFFGINGYNKRIKEALIKSGALDCFGLERHELLNIALDIDNEIKIERNKIDSANQKIISKQQEIDNSREGTKKVATLYKQIINLKDSIEKSNNRISELEYSKRKESCEATEEIEVLGFCLSNKWTRYNPNDYETYNPEKTITQNILVDIDEVYEINDKKGRRMAFIKAAPYNQVVQRFVMFANNYKPIDKGIYVFQIRNKNHIVGVAKAKRT